MTATILEPSVDVITELDSEWAIPCVLVRPWGCGGDNAAAWIAYGADCCPVPKVSFYCGPCKDFMLTGAHSIICNACHHVFQPAATAFKLIEPLNPSRP